MKHKHAVLEQEWQVMDVRKMGLEDDSVDIAIDKVSPAAGRYI